MKYDKNSLKAEEFINNEEILETVRYAEEHKDDLKLIDEILKKAKKRKGLDHRDASVLLACSDESRINEIYDLAEQIKKDFYGNRIVLLEADAHRMHPGDIGQRLLYIEGAAALNRHLAVDARIDIIERHTVALYIGKRRGKSMSVIGVCDGLRACFTDAEGTDRDFGVNIGVVFRRGPVQRRQCGIRREAGEGKGLAAFFVPHREHWKPGVGLLPVIILQVHAFPERLRTGIAVVKIPLPGREVVEIREFLRQRLVEKDLCGEAEIAGISFLDGNGPENFNLSACIFVAV